MLLEMGFHAKYLQILVCCKTNFLLFNHSHRVSSGIDNIDYINVSFAKNTKKMMEISKESPRPRGSAQKKSLPVILVKIREKEKFLALVVFYTFVSNCE